MDEDLDLASRADLERGIDELGCLRGLAHVGLDDDGLGAVGLDLLSYLLGALATTGGDIVDDNVGTALAQENSDTSTKAARKLSVAMSCM